jgi:phosphatidylglycerophosphate synthase
MTESTKATFKPRDVEELIDFYFHRPLASLLVRALAPTSITPNQVTILSGLSALLGAVLIGAADLEDPWLIYVGAAAFFASILFDCADGQLARLRGVSSFAGRSLDGVVDAAATACVFWGLGIFMMRAGYHWAYVIPMGFAAGLSMRWHVHTYDHVKNMYLHNTTPRSESDKAPAFPTYEEIEAERQEHLRAGRRAHAVLCTIFVAVTKSQRDGVEGRAGLGAPAMQTDAQRELYRETFRGHMRAWTFNGLGTHLFLTILVMIATPHYTGAALAFWWFLLVPVNLFQAYLMRREKTLEHSVQEAATAA